MRRQSPQDLLNIDIFFDGVGVHGDVRLAETIWHHAYDRGAASCDFTAFL